MTRSFDRTSASLDNAHTFLLLERRAAGVRSEPGAVGATSRTTSAIWRASQNKEVYIIAGRRREQGHAQERGQDRHPGEHLEGRRRSCRATTGLADIRDYRDLEVIAVNMPNVAGRPQRAVADVPDDRRRDRGADRLRPPRAPARQGREHRRGRHQAAARVRRRAVRASTEGGAITMSAAGVGRSQRHRRRATSGTSATAPPAAARSSPTPTRRTASTRCSLVGHRQRRPHRHAGRPTATVANVAPIVGAFAGATLLPGETYTASGSFTDPGADPWTATVDYGDGTGTDAARARRADLLARAHATRPPASSP